MSLSDTTRTTIFNTLRKNIALLKRNRSDYSNAEFTYTGADADVNNNDFNHKRVYIAEGGDIVIHTGILMQDHPLAIIALKDPVTNSGGNIRIATGVTDIHATLIAEGAVIGSGSRQLYIHGTIISNNSIGGSRKVPRECPYFDNNPCNAYRSKKYDLEYLRD